MYAKGFTNSLVNKLYSYPEIFLAISFFILIVIGTCLLKIPWASKGDLSWIDALFTATSSVCVTGLVVKNTAADFTILGQVIILSLIQLGAIGIMTFSASLVVAMGRKLSSRQAEAMRKILDQERLEELKDSILFILRSTLFLELVGVVLLASHWALTSGDFWRSLYWGVFHSVSAFCNAGFSVFPDGFMRFRSDVLVNLFMSFLVVAGGLGFLVLRDLGQFVARKKRLSVHTKLMLVGTILLLLIGSVGLYLLNLSNFSKLPLKDRILVSIFHSVNARTAGFNSIDIDGLSLASKFLLILLMFVGAGSGSTGGGVKVSTFLVLFLASWRYVLGHEEVVVYRRTIPWAVFQKAVAILVFALGVVSLGIMGISFFDPQLGFDKIAFEVVSAFATVGLSCGITPDLSNPSKVIIVLLMFVGRLGPLTIAMALIRSRKHLKVHFAEGRVMVG